MVSVLSKVGSQPLHLRDRLASKRTETVPQMMIHLKVFYIFGGTISHMERMTVYVISTLARFNVIKPKFSMSDIRVFSNH